MFRFVATSYNCKFHHDSLIEDVKEGVVQYHTARRYLSGGDMAFS